MSTGDSRPGGLVGGTGDGGRPAGRPTGAPAAGAQSAALPTESVAAGEHRRQPPRGAVRRTACPACGAEEGAPCVRSRGGRPRVAHHMARVEAYLARASGAAQDTASSSSAAVTGAGADQHELAALTEQSGAAEL